MPLPFWFSANLKLSKSKYWIIIATKQSHSLNYKEKVKIAWLCGSWCSMVPPVYTICLREASSRPPIHVENDYIVGVWFCRMMYASSWTKKHKEDFKLVIVNAAFYHGGGPGHNHESWSTTHSPPEKLVLIVHWPTQKPDFFKREFDHKQYT